MIEGTEDSGAESAAPQDMKEKFRQALAAKNAKQGGYGNTGAPGGKGGASGATAGHTTQRFQRKSGG